MRSVVLVPTFQRSDLLFLCLEAIRKAEPEIPIEVFPDRSTDERSICSHFNAIHHFTLNHNEHGNTVNVCEAMRWATEQRFDRIHVIEDDAIIDQSYFRWCDEVLTKESDMFAACGWMYSPSAIISDGPAIRIAWYLSVCACIPLRSALSIHPHCRPEYYRDMKGYLDQTFPASHQRGTMHYEQDGMVLRVMESVGKRCIWPRRPRATHCGWYGYHMDGKPLSGTLESRVEALRLIIQDAETLKKVMAGAPLPQIGRCEECGKALMVEGRSRAVCVNCFHVGKRVDWPRTSNSCYYLAG